MDGLVIVLVVLIVLAAAGIQVMKFLPQWRHGREKQRWAAGGTPKNINWQLLTRPDIQKLIPGASSSARTLYWKESKGPLNEAEEAIEFAILYPDRVAAEAARAQMAAQPKMSVTGANQDIFNTPEMQAFLPDRRIDAIKLYRQQTGVGLKEATEAVANYLDTHPPAQKG